jgi:acyl-CoA synthetase (AMP-forming)/AMP-acid ligase II
VFTPVSPLLTAPIIGALLRDCGASALFATDDLMPRAKDAIAHAGLNGHLAVYGCADLPTSEPLPADEEPQSALAESAGCTLIYSSGTTGTPKGILHSHRARAAMGLSVAAASSFDDHSRTLSCIPLHSNGAFIFLLPALMLGGSVIITERFSAEQFLSTVEQHRATHAFVVPTMLQAIAALPQFEKADLTSLTSLVSGGAPLPAALQANMSARFGQAFCHLWGLTEGLATLLRSGDRSVPVDCVGWPLPSVELRIAAADGEARPGEVGEILGRSSFLMSGYWLGASEPGEGPWVEIGGERWLRTGDLGSIDSRGRLVLRGRLKDLIISGGLNVYPSDIEPVLLQHDAVLDAAVLGASDVRWGESPVAFVRVRPGCSADAEQIRSWINMRVAAHQRLREVHLVHDQDLPRNALGKVLKSELKRMLDMQADR